MYPGTVHYFPPVKASTAGFSLHTFSPLEKHGSTSGDAKEGDGRGRHVVTSGSGDWLSRGLGSLRLGRSLGLLRGLRLRSRRGRGLLGSGRSGSRGSGSGRVGLRSRGVGLGSRRRRLGRVGLRSRRVGLRLGRVWLRSRRVGLRLRRVGLQLGRDGKRAGVAGLLDLAVVTVADNLLVAVVGAGLEVAAVVLADELLLLLRGADLDNALIAVADVLLAALLAVALAVVAGVGLADNKLVARVGVADLGAADLGAADNLVLVAVAETVVTVADDGDVNVDEDVGVTTVGVGGRSTGGSGSSGARGGGDDIANTDVDGQDETRRSLTAEEAGRGAGATTALVRGSRARNVALGVVDEQSSALVEVISTVAVLGVDTEGVTAVAGCGTDVQVHGRVRGGEREGRESIRSANATESLEGADASRQDRGSGRRRGGRGGGRWGSHRRVGEHLSRGHGGQADDVNDSVAHGDCLVEQRM